MYSVAYENDDMIIRFNKDLAEGDALSKFLGHINLQSMLKKATRGDSKERMKLQSRLRDFPIGLALLRDPALNKGTAFTEQERDALRFRGLPPPHVSTMDEQLLRVIRNLQANPTDREVSAVIAATVAEVAYKRGIATRLRPDSLPEYIRSLIFEPEYHSYI